MPAGRVPCPDSVELQRNHFSVKHGHDPAHRAHEAFSRLAPVHVFRPVDRVDFFGKKCRENLSGGSAFLRYSCGQILALGRAHFFKLRDFDSRLLRERTGRGTAISVGLFDSVAEWMGYALNQARYAGLDLEPIGVGSPAVAPYGAYLTADGQTLVLGTTNDREWRRLASDVLHRPDLADDPRYARNPDRVARRAELDVAIGEWAAGRALAECRRAAEAAGLGHARLNRPTEVLSHPQLRERGRWQEVGSPVGPVLGLLPPPESDDWDWRLDPIPALGEHTEPVLRELGFGAGDLAGLRAEGVIARAGPQATDYGSST